MNMEDKSVTEEWYSLACEVESRSCHVTSLKDGLGRVDGVRANHRRKLVGWMFEVCFASNLPLECGFLAVRLFDRMLTFGPTVTVCKCQLVGSACMVLASKICFYKPIRLCEMVEAADNCFTLVSLKETEALVLRVLNCRLHTPTILCFLFYPQHHWSDEQNRIMVYLAMQSCLCERLSDMRPSVVSMAIVALVSMTSGDDDQTRKVMIDVQAVQTVKEVVEAAECLVAMENQDNMWTEQEVIVRYRRIDRDTLRGGLERLRSALSGNIMHTSDI